MSDFSIFSHGRKPLQLLLFLEFCSWLDRRKLREVSRLDPVNWLERLRDGDPAAMEPLLSEYGPMMDYIVRGILSDVHAREDCLA